MSDIPQLLVDCQKWYVEENGKAVYENYRRTLGNAFANPTEIKCIKRTDPKLTEALALIDKLVEALERAKWDIVACGIIKGRTSIHEDQNAIEEILHYANQIEEHQIPAKARIEPALAYVRERKIGG